MLPKISIVTPSFNQGQFLAQTIESVLSQNYPNLEYVIIDGGSTDSSVDIIKRHEKYLSYWISERDKGQSHAINKGYRHCSGDVFNWLNSDDFLHPSALSIIGEYFSDPAVKVLCGRGNIIVDGKVIRISSGTDIYDLNLDKTIGMARIDQPETWFRKVVFDKLTPVNENLNYVMDRELWLKFLLLEGLQGIQKVNDILVNFRIHPESKTSSKANHFEKENDTLFLRLAEMHLLEKDASIIRACLSPSEMLQVNLPVIPSRQLVHSALQYFFLYKADVLYYRKQLNIARKILSHIDQSQLNREDVRLLKKLEFRSNVLIAFFVNFLK
jgi:glycosyltransferase involved in cell wall biosynthesis